MSDEDWCGAKDACDEASNNGDACDRNGPGADDDETCSAGHCCPHDWVWCGDECVDPSSDEDWCGATGNCTTATNGDDCDVEDNETCVNKVCCNTEAGNVVCNGQCINPLITEAFCGASGVTCSDVGDSCSGVENVCCEGDCTDPLEDDVHCGATVNAACGTPASGGTDCAEDGLQCTRGHCCNPGWVWCNGACRDPATNPDYCGVNGQCAGGSGPENDGDCGAGTCVASMCQPA